MNEQTNTRLVQQAYQSVKAGDFQSFLNALAEDVQWQLPEMENVPFSGTLGTDESERGGSDILLCFSKVAQDARCHGI